MNIYQFPTLVALLKQRGYEPSYTTREEGPAAAFFDVFDDTVGAVTVQYTLSLRPMENTVVGGVNIVIRRNGTVVWRYFTPGRLSEEQRVQELRDAVEEFVRLCPAPVPSQFTYVLK
jgi:hypothetical protein